MALLATAVSASVANGQVQSTQSGPRFDSVSIQLSRSTAPEVKLLPGGRLSATAPLLLLIETAYGVSPSQIAGGADWMGSEFYEVEARGKSDANAAQARLMLQSLLEDQFGLKIHR